MILIFIFAVYLSFIFKIPLFTFVFVFCHIPFMLLPTESFLLTFILIITRSCGLVQLKLKSLC